jgi:hypothetical protein
VLLATDATAEWLCGLRLQPILVVNVHSASGLPHRLAPLHAASSSTGGDEAMLQPVVELQFQVKCQTWMLCSRCSSGPAH